MADLSFVFENWNKYINKLVEQECRILGAEQGLGLPREQQPQIKPDQVQNFIIYLRDAGIQVLKTKKPVLELIPSQETVDWDKVRSIAKTQNMETISNGIPIFVGQDNVICDGTHRWMALKLIDKHSSITCWEIKLDALSALKQMKNFLNTIDG